MLLSQNRRRHQHRYLLAAHHGLERRPQSDFRLAEPDVAAQQAVHRRWLFHVGFDFGDGGQLVRRFLKRERILEFRLPGRVGQESKAGRQAAPGVQIDQFPGQIGHGGLGPGFRLRPVRSAQPGKLRGFPLRTDVFLEQLHLVGRHVKFVVRRIADMEIIAVHPVQFDGFHTHILADAMGHMHDKVAGFKLGIVGDPAGLACPAATLQFEASLDFPFGDDCQPVIRQLEAGRHIAGRHEYARITHDIGAGERLGLDALFNQAFPQNGRRLDIGHQKQNPVPPVLPGQNVIDQKVGLTVIRRYAAGDQPHGLRLQFGRAGGSQQRKETGFDRCCSFFLKHFPGHAALGGIRVGPPRSFDRFSQADYVIEHCHRRRR